MTKCVSCKRFLSPKAAATCATCHGTYHRSCVGEAETATISFDWSCPECVEKEVTADDSVTSLKRIGDTQPPLRAASPASPFMFPTGKDTEVATFRREFDRYMAEQREFRAEQREFRSEIRATLKSLCVRTDELERRLVAVETREADAPPRDSVVEGLQQTVARLQTELGDRDQEALLSDLDIGHVPEVKGENVVHTVTVLAVKLGVVLEARDVVFAERVGAVERDAAGGADADVGRGGRPRRIVVRLARRQLRDEMLRAARVRRNFTSADISLPGPARRIYVNERLTRTNRQLFQRVREECRKLQWRFAWTKRGRVYARQADGKQSYCIRSDADVVRVFGISHV